MSTTSSHPIRRLPGRAAAVPAAALALVLLAAAAASAHVTVHSAGAHEGGSATLTFKVPNEEANASTTKIEIDLPAATPLSGVTVTAPTGWTSQVTEDKIVFSGGKISGDDEVLFPVQVDKLPMSPTVVFKALQTYSDGNVVRWIEQAPAGAPEPAHPAPTLKLLPPVPVAAADSKAGMSVSGMNMKPDGSMPVESAKPSATAKPAASAKPTVSAKPAATSTSAAAAPTATAAAASKSPTAPTSVKAGDGGQTTVAVPMHDGAKATAPKAVHAGTGGQASDGSTSSVPVVPLTALLAGLGVAGLAARRLARR